MKFGFMLVRGTIEAVYMFLVDIETAFDGVPRKFLELALRKKGIPEFFGWISDESV